jgi:hypothetical protein
MPDNIAPAPTTSNAKLPLTSLVATGGTGQVSLSWTDPNAPSVGARVQRSFLRTVPESSFRDVGNSKAPSSFQDIGTTAGTAYTDTTALPGITYSYRVFPRNPAPMFVEAPPSNVATATVNGATSPHMSVTARFNQIYAAVAPYPVLDGSWGL